MIQIIVGDGYLRWMEIIKDIYRGISPKNYDIIELDAGDLLVLVQRKWQGSGTDGFGPERNTYPNMWSISFYPNLRMRLLKSIYEEIILNNDSWIHNHKFHQSPSKVVRRKILFMLRTSYIMKQMTILTKKKVSHKKWMPWN